MTPFAEGHPVHGEYEVKAAFLLNFARFVEWRPETLPAGAPLQIGIVGKHDFGTALDHVIRGRSANGHPIVLRQLQWQDDLTNCHIVFISASEESNLTEILTRLGKHQVLTVSDIDRFSLRGGMVELRMVGNRVRFDINRASARDAHITISSKLLNVARAVHAAGAER
ncbi:MAG TPA: YfiR family protein [Thermoanaerobaculia bacterium]